MSICAGNIIILPESGLAFLSQYNILKRPCQNTDKQAKKKNVVFFGQNYIWYFCVLKSYTIVYCNSGQLCLDITQHRRHNRSA